MSTELQPEPVVITSVRFRNFKALSDYSVALRHMNILVGPNNSGKSTIIGAFRVLSVGMARARARKPELVPGPGGYTRGYPIPEDSVPISLENIHTNYQDVNSSATFRLSNGNELILHFPAQGSRFSLLFETQGRRITGPGDFRREFPISIGVVPMLGPLEHEEELLQEETVRRGLTTHRAPRHFRNYWYHYPAEFDCFRAHVQGTWPGMDILRPELASLGDTKLAMFCTEDRISRELFWAGNGFQVWCQILTHLGRQRDITALVIDEPELYLHPNLQRQLVSILRDSGPDIVLATHSSDLVADAEPLDLLLIDKKRGAARRIDEAAAISLVLASLGSSHNFVLTQLARTRRVVFVEGQDFKILERFARRLGIQGLSSNQEFSVIPLEGFPTLDRLRSVCLGVRLALGLNCAFAGVFDRDYRPESELQELRDAFESELVFAHIHERKELENYLFSPVVLDRALSRAAAEHFRRTGERRTTGSSAAAMLEELTDSMKDQVFASYQAARLEKQPAHQRSSILRETNSWLDATWATLDGRLEIVPGKQLLSRFLGHVQETIRISVSPRAIIDAFETDDFAADLRRLIRGLDQFRAAKPD